MQRLARYPLEKENRAMMTTKAKSWLKTTPTLEFSTLQNMSSGMKTRRDKTAAGNRTLCFGGCVKETGIVLEGATFIYDT